MLYSAFAKKYNNNKIIKYYNNLITIKLTVGVVKDYFFTNIQNWFDRIYNLSLPPGEAKKTILRTVK